MNLSIFIVFSMKLLYKLLKKYTLEDALNFEKQDLQFKAIEKLYARIEDKELFFWLILANSIICYQLSSSGEKYWEEFCSEASEHFLELKERTQVIFPSPKEWQLSVIIIWFLIDFIPNSIWNKRLIEVKIKRLEKTKDFLTIFLNNIDYYISNLIFLRDELSKTMNQKKDAKTIVFAIKMIMYGIRIIEDKKWKEKRTIQVIYPTSPSLKLHTTGSWEWQLINQISIPIDSRLIKIFEIYKEDYTDIKKFYKDLSTKLQIPEIHLDAILWLNYNELIYNKKS